MISLLCLVNVQFVFPQSQRDIELANQYIIESKELGDSDRNKTISLLNKALDIYQQENNALGLANTYLNISSWYIDENQWDTSMSLSYRALKYGESLNDSIINSKVFLNLAIVNYHLQQLSSAERFNRKAILFGDKEIEARATVNLGMIFSNKNEIDSAFYFFEKANQIFISLNDSSDNVISNIAISNMNMGTIELKRGQFAEAKKYFNESLRACYNINDFNSIVMNYLNFGNVFSIEKKYLLAEEVINRASFIADSVQLYSLSNLTTYALSNVLFAKGDYKKSHELLNQYLVIKDSLSGVDIENKIANLQMKYEVEKQNQQITLLEKDKKLSVYRMLFIVLIILVFSGIIIYNINKIRLNSRRKMAISEKNRVETQNKLEKAKSDIQYYTKLIQENTEKIECFENELLNSNKEDSAELKKKQEKLRGMKILKDEDWIYYKTLFREVDSVFYDKVVSIPNLTEGDKRQIFLIKLGYTNKMSADVLGISTEGIKRARQRLAKKLNLKDASKLEDYFSNL